MAPPISDEGVGDRGHGEGASKDVDSLWSQVSSRQLLEACPDAMIVVDDQSVMVDINSEAEKLFGYTRAEVRGEPIETLVPEHRRGSHVKSRMAYAASPRVRFMGAGLNIEARRKDGSTFPADVKLSPLELPSGVFVTAAVRDITEQVEREATLRRQLEEIESQRAAIEEMQAPAIEVAGGILLLPLIGAVTSERAAHLSSRILHEIERMRAVRLILDLGGVPAVDTAVAAHLLQIVNAAALLGCPSTLTGIRPETAQVITSLGIDLSRVEVRRTLKDALARAR